MNQEVNKLRNEITEKEKFLGQGKNSLREFIKDKIGFVSIIIKY